MIALVRAHAPSTDAALYKVRSRRARARAARVARLGLRRDLRFYLVERRLRQMTRRLRRHRDAAQSRARSSSSLAQDRDADLQRSIEQRERLLLAWGRVVKPVQQDATDERGADEALVRRQSSCVCTSANNFSSMGLFLLGAKARRFA